MSEAYKHGYSDAIYGFSYINPYYNEQEMKEWIAGKNKIDTSKSVGSDRDGWK